MSKEKVILAYSGGLDTSVAITWLNKDYDVVAVCMDVGEGKDLDFTMIRLSRLGQSNLMSLMLRTNLLQIMC